MFSALLIFFSAILTSTDLAAVGLSAFAGYGAVGIGIGVVTGLLLIVAYVWSYTPARRGYYLRARTPTLVLGIVFVVLIITVVIGILYLFAYARLRDAEPEPSPFV